MTTPDSPSRREFLAAAAMGLIACARGSGAVVQGIEPRSDDALLYVGTYTEGGRKEGIYLVMMDRSSGALRQIGSLDAGPNPSFLAIHPSGRVLYAVNEVDTYNGQPTGAVSSFSIAGETGALSPVDQQPSGGAAPCYVSLDRHGRVVLVANYNGGSIALLPTEADGTLAPASQLIRHTGSGPVTDRQAGPHAHCIITDPSNQFVLAADLGADRVFLYRFGAEGRTLIHVEGGDARMRSGAGPRHLAFHPSLPLVFVSNELDSTVATVRFDSARGTLTVLGTQSTLPRGWTGTNYPADIHVAPSGRTVYVSNRGHNSIAVFSAAESGALTLEQTVSTEGDWPRNFTLDPTGRWLLVANQRSNSIVMYARDEISGRLTVTGHRLELPSPVCLRFGAR